MASALRRFILWDYPRGSWQYDVVVILIVCFIFLTPRELFKDQPRASSVVLMSSEGGNEIYYLESKLLEGLDESGRMAKATALLKNKEGKKHELYQLKPFVMDGEQEVKGFLAYTHTRK